MSYKLVKVTNKNASNSNTSNSGRSFVAFALSSATGNEAAIGFHMVDDASLKEYNVIGEASISIRKSVSQQFQNNPLNRNRSVAGDYELFGTLSLAPSATNMGSLQTYTVNTTNSNAGSGLFRF